MKIESITLHHVSMPLIAPFETSFGRETNRQCILVKLHAEGITGYGECVASGEPGYSYETTGTAWHILKDFISPLILGKNLSDVSEFQNLIDPIRGHHLAKAGVEMAMWDLFGKMSGRSLREMFGGVKTKVDVGVSVGIQPSPDALVNVVDLFLEKGYRRIKIKIKPGREVKEASAVRKAYPELLLQVDANSAYTLETAAALKPLDDFGLLLIEQPLFEDDIWDHRKLQAEYKTPICLDESIVSPRHARYALEMKACKIINIKAGRVGGLSQGVEIHDLCLEQDIPVWCGGMLETGVGRASNLALASLPGFKLPGDISASARYYQQDVTNESFDLNADSTIDVPNKPGLGITINEKALRDFTIASVTIKAD